MSHITSYKTNIKLETAIGKNRPVEEDPGWEILDQAIWAAAEEFNMNVSHTIKDYYGRSIYCDWAISGPEMPRGLGINVDRDTGQVLFSADTYGGFERIVEQVKERVVQNYSTICVTKALSALNYKVEVEEIKHPVEGKKVFVRGVL